MHWTNAYILIASGLGVAAFLTVAGVEVFKPDFAAPGRFLARKWRRRWRYYSIALFAVSRLAGAIGGRFIYVEAHASTMAFRFNCIHRAAYRPKRTNEIGAPI